MKTEQKQGTLMHSTVSVALATFGLLLIPFVGNAVSTEWDWNLFDFIIMGILIFSTGMTYQIMTKTMFKKHRLIVGIVLALVFFLIWAELAVGIFGTPFAGN